MNQTTIDEVRQMSGAGDYRLIPIKREILSDIRTPVETLRALKSVSDHVFLLESCEDSRKWGRYSFLGYAPEMTVTAYDHEMTVAAPGSEETFHTDDPGLYIDGIIKDNSSPRPEGFPPFTGGLVGYFGYEYMHYKEPTVTFNGDDPYGFKDMDLMLFTHLICYDNYMQKIILIANVRTDDIEGSYEKAVSKLDEMEDLIRHASPGPAPAGRLKSELRPLFSEEEYCRKVERVKHHIHEGDIFQLVLSNPMEADFEGSLLNTYRVLRTTNPSPYMFYFSGDTEIAGASPETLVKVTDGVIRTFPLAGTRPRGADHEEDKRLEEELLADEKERAEHNMLVDLGRNDLGRLCKFGTVEVEKYMEIEKYSHVMHIGSEVKGILSPEHSSVEAIDRVLPAGTLSGAPKIKACQLIDEIEGSRRGIYGGAIGYVDFTGNLDTCIAIRLAFSKAGKVFVRSGAGIVADSVPESEYRESINKARAVVLAIKEADNI